MKKSLMAKLVTIYLKLTFKRRYSKNNEKARKQLLNVQKAGEKKYRPPKMNLGCSVKKQNIVGMDFYILNDESKAQKTVFYIHGGGYVHQALYFHWRFVKKLIKRTNARVVFPIYPLAPFYTYKDMYDKIQELYNAYADISDEIIFMGDSAGGGFVLSFYEYLLTNNLRLPNKVISISPWLDLKSDNPKIPEMEKTDPMLVQSTLQLWAEFWAGEQSNHYMVSPINFNRTDELKNITLFIGTEEILYPDALKFFDKIKDNPGCELIIGQGMSHVYPLYPIPEAKPTLKHMVNIIMGTKFD